MVKALESYLKEDHEALNREWQRRLEFVSARITKVPGASTSYMVPDIANHVPHMEIKWDAKRIPLTPAKLEKLCATENRRSFFPREKRVKFCL